MIRKDVPGRTGWWVEINDLFGGRARIVVTDGMFVDVGW